MYRKPTFTGVYLHWDSLTSRKYKIGLIKCLLNRIWRICSDLETRSLETSRAKSILLKNNYPAHVLDKEITKFVANKKKLESNVRNSIDPTTMKKELLMCHERYAILSYRTLDRTVSLSAKNEKLKRLVEKTYSENGCKYNRNVVQ